MQKPDIAAYRSFRLSLRWLPDKADEPTNTLVLTAGRTGAFVDTRFFKDTGELDWAFAGYRSIDTNTPNLISFKHLIDSRTLDEITDKGINSTLPDGTTLEVGEMINPATGKITSFEEVWRDEEEVNGATVLFVRNTSGRTWQGRVGGWQCALGRREDGTFWAWQAEQAEGDRKWEIKHSTNVINREITLLPEYKETEEWKEGAIVDWVDDTWMVLERGRT